MRENIDTVEIKSPDAFCEICSNNRQNSSVSFMHLQIGKRNISLCDYCSEALYYKLEIWFKPHKTGN